MKKLTCMLILGFIINSSVGQDVFLIDSFVCIKNSSSQLIEEYVWKGWNLEAIIPVKDEVIESLSRRNVHLTNLNISYNNDISMLRGQVKELSLSLSALNAEYSTSLREYLRVKDERDLYEGQIKQRTRERMWVYGGAGALILLIIALSN